MDAVQQDHPGQALTETSDSVADKVVCMARQMMMVLVLVLGV